MKKMLAMLLAAVMLLGCMTLAVAEALDVTGTWYLNKLVADGMTLNAADLGMNLMLTLNEDGTAVSSVVGVEDEGVGSWAMTDGALTVTIDEDTLEVAVVDGSLVIEDDGAQMVFTREASVPAFVPAAVVAIEDVAAVDGTWNVSLISVMGLTVSMEEAGTETMEMLLGDAEPQIVLEGGNVSLFGGDMAPATLADGVLTIGSEEEGMLLTISLLEDGMLDLNMMGIEFYFVKAE